jgi:hypothetical protein
VAIVVLILLGIGGVVLANRGSNNPGGGTALKSPSPSAKATGSPKASANPSPTGHAPLTVPSYADAKNDPITKVQFCTPEKPCPIAVGVPSETATACDVNSCVVEVAVYFSAPQKVPVHYDLKFFDRCTGAEKLLPGPHAYTPPNYAVVIPGPADGKWGVSIPAGTKSGALVAVTDQPAIAASAPLLIGSTDTC